jgi:H+/Cl- antiporter ClcA
MASPPPQLSGAAYLRLVALGALIGIPAALIGDRDAPVANGPGIALAAIGTLAFGAVLGPEAPLIALGAVTGIMVTSFVKLSE